MQRLLLLKSIKKSKIERNDVDFICLYDFTTHNLHIFDATQS